ISDSVPVGRLLTKLGQAKPESASPQERIAEMAEEIRASLQELRGVIPLALPRGSQAESGYEEAIQLGLASRKAAQQPMIEAFARLRARITDLAHLLAEGVEAAQKMEIRADPALDLLKLHADRFESYRQRLGALLGEGGAG